MKFRKFILFILASFILVGCQTIKEKSDAVAEKENLKYGKFVVYQQFTGLMLIIFIMQIQEWMQKI